MYGLWLFKELKTEYGYCKIEIFKKSYSSSPIEIEAVEANSLTLSIENLSETISPIGKSVCSFSIVDTGQLSYDDFFTPDATGIKVVISTINEDRGDVAYTTRWSGFVTPDFYSESLVYRTAINISARDNIGYLSDVEFDLVEPSIQIRELFSKAFAKISEQYPMDVMFRSHKTTEDGVLLTDAVISTALFKDKTWGEVLELILHDLGLQMRWVDNNTIAVIDLSQIPEYYLPTQFQFINASGYREVLPAWRNLSQKQEFGIRENSFDGNITSQNLRFVDIEEPITPIGGNYYESKVAYYAPTNWQTTGDIFTTDPAYYNDANSKKIYFTAANINDVHSRYMSWRQDISKTEIPLSISFKALNSLSMPSRIFGEEGVEAPRILIPFQFNKVTISKFDGGTLQIGIIYDIFLYSGLKKYKLNYNWVDVSDGTQTAPLKFVLPEMYFSGEDDDEPPVPKEEECVININGIPATGELEFVIYGWYFITIQDTWNETFNKGVEWEKFFAYVNEVTYTFENNSKGTGQEAKTSINPLHNILRNEKYQFGNVPKYGGGLGAYAGGLFNLVGEELSTFKRNEDSQSYNLLELVGREIIHFNKKNYNKLSGEIKSPTKEPLKFNSLFSREGKLYYPFSCSLNVIDNTMTITSMQEVEPYITESFTEIHSEVKSDGGTTVSGGNNTVLQYSEDAGNAKRLYEMQDATPAEKEKAFALVDSSDFPQARRIRVADLIGLDEQALAQYLELNKYVQENDLTPITNRIGAVEGYFTNGSAKDALKLGGIDAGNYWHKGNSGTLDYDWKAKKLNVRTLVIPTSEPTDLSEGEVGFYLGTAGQGAEEPNGSGGLDLTELWAELGSEDYAKKIHISHIPTIQYSSIAGRPSALVNPYALTINGVVYDGSEPISLDISAGGGVADAVAWSNVFNKPSTISGYGITDAYTKDSVDLKLRGYLPKSGGTITGNYNALSIKRNNAYASLIQFENTDGVMGYLGFNSANVPVAYNRTADTMYTLIHSGNIGSQSVAGLINEVLTDLNNGSYGRIFTMTSGYGSTDGNKPDVDWVTGITLRHANNPQYRTQLAITTREKLYLRREHGGTWQSWHEIAFTDSNVASATKLQTARNIWGQSFDGSSNVNGNITINSQGGNKFGIKLGHYQSWAGSYYPTLMSDASDKYIMFFNPHIVRSKGDYMNGSTIRMESFNYKYWDISVAQDDRDTFKIRYNNTDDLLTIDKSSIYALNLNSIADNYSIIHFLNKGTAVADFGWLNVRGNFSYVYNNSSIGCIAVNKNGAYYSTNPNNMDMYALYHTGNFNPANYLPTSGGILSDSWSGGTEIRRKDSTNGYASLIFSQADGTVLGRFGFGGIDNPLFITQSGAYNTLIHSGNIGSQSVDYANSAARISSTWNIDCNVASDDGVKIISNRSPYTGNFPIDYTSGLSVMSDYVGWQLVSYGGDVENPYFRSYQDNGTWKPWKQLAFLTDNVASATKLQTARTIWGQSFDGTGNVSGAMSGVNSITSNITNGYFVGNRNDGLGVTTGGLLLYSYNATPISFWTNKSERMHITAGGNILIGTNTDNGSKLQVNGAMEATELVIPTAPPTNPQAGKHYLYLA